MKVAEFTTSDPDVNVNVSDTPNDQNEWITLFLSEKIVNEP